MKPTQKRKAFTLIELLVVITIIAILAALATPALTNAIVQGQMTQTLNNARQVYLAGFQMSLDGASTQDPSLVWPGSTANLTFPLYIQKLVDNDYLKAGEISKLFSAPGKVSDATVANSTVTITAGASALKIYTLTDASDSRTLFTATTNFVYNTALTGSPYGDKGFIVVRKGGDASKLRKAQAISADANTYQSNVGKLPGDADGTLGSEGATNVLQ